MRVRDLEIALVLAREMKAAAARSVEASLRLDQLQEVFGVERLDRTERARIQTALQMAGLEPFPSLLEADPTEPIRFGASQAAAATAGAPGADAGGTVVPQEPVAAEEAPTFPTVGQFARSKLGGRSRRRFGVRRGDHVEGDAPLPPPPPPPEADEEYAESNGHMPEPDATQVHHEVLPEAGEEGPEVEVDEFPAEEVDEFPAEEVDEFPVEVEEPAGEAEEPAAEIEEPAAEVEEPLAEPDVGEPAEDDEPFAEVDEEEPLSQEEPFADQPAHDEPVTAIHEAPEFEDHHEPEDEREYIPLVPDQPLAYEPAPEPEPHPAGARVEDVVAALLPAVAIPVIVTSIAGWRFGLPFVALSVIATGWLMSRRKPAGAEKRGLLATLRRTPAAVTALRTTALVTVLSIAAAVALAAVGKNDSSTKGNKTATPPAKKPHQPAAASKPATPSTRQTKKPHRKTPATTTPSSGPPPDPATQGLVRVPPQSSTPSTGTGPNGTGTGTGTRHGHGHHDHSLGPAQGPCHVPA